MTEQVAQLPADIRDYEELLAETGLQFRKITETEIGKVLKVADGDPQKSIYVACIDTNFEVPELLDLVYPMLNVTDDGEVNLEEGEKVYGMFLLTAGTGIKGLPIVEMLKTTKFSRHFKEIVLCTDNAILKNVPPTYRFKVSDTELLLFESSEEAMQKLIALAT